MKKALSLILVLVMLIGMMPMTAFATEADSSEENGVSLDSIAWEDLTYRDIFITNNLAYLNGFDNNNWGTYKQYAGTNTVSDEAHYTPPYSLKAAGSPSQQIVSWLRSSPGDYFVASKVNCTRYVKGELGVCLKDTTVGVTALTDGFVTAANIVTIASSHGIYIGSLHSADLDGYVDDTVVVNMNIFSTKPSSDELTELYERYVEIEMYRDRTEVISNDTQKLDAFMTYLKEKAKTIGMVSSVFDDPVGNSCNWVTARDVAKLLLYANNYEELHSIWSLPSKEITIDGINARTKTVVSTVIKDELEQYYHILGGKTGTLGSTRNLSVILGIPGSDDKLVVVALCANGANGAEGNRYEAVKEIADLAVEKYINPDIDHSGKDVCCASAIACLLPADGVNTENLTVLYEKDADTLRNPASITKVLTAICALDVFDSLNVEITYKQFDITTCPWNSGDFYDGDKMTLEHTLFALLLPSNDVTAFTVARSAGEIILKENITIPEDPPHTHVYAPSVTAPTCTEQGYTTYTCECGESYADDFVDALGHTYKNGLCTTCGAEHPNLANFGGKVISILGDSISTFEGYIPVDDGFNLKHYARYPQDNLLTDVNDTWWMQVLVALDAKLGINDSWRSTEVYNYIDSEVNSSYDGTKACMASTTRIQNLGSNGTPDVILFYGGTNDITQRRPVGSFDPEKAPVEVDLTSVKWDTVADAYVDAVMRMQHYYPDAEIIAMLPTFTYKNTDEVIEEYNSVFAEICEHYGVAYIDLRDCGITTADLPDGTHPDAEGMDYITATVMDTLLTECTMEAGEHIVYSVTHDLSGAESSIGYYKGISRGRSLSAVITGENLNVMVTMAGTDVTAETYTDGVVFIANVIGDVVITAEGIKKTIYEDYLQELPANFCSSTNLWSVLDPINLYYTATGWGVNATGLAHSVTIPISEGDQIWATSFQKSGTNGGNADGIRLTWFDKDGVLKALSTSATYKEFSANGCLTAPEGAVAVNVVMWNGDESNELYILNRDHTYENGLCTICGENEPSESMSLRYDDHIDMSSKTVEIIDAGMPTSYQVGYGVEENKVLDTAVVTLDGDALVATGIGTAQVRMDGILYEVTVEAAPISLILLIGQSNMRGSEGNADQSIVCPDGMVYATFGDDRGDAAGIMNVNNATKFAASALAGPYSTINVEGTTEHLSFYPLNSLTADGAGTFGPDSGFAYEWVKQTGEKVWIVNAAHGGSSITSWQPNATNFKEAVLLFSACQETLRKEIAAGHFTLSHMGYFWCQGCSDYSWTAEKYVTNYLAMHGGLKQGLRFDHDSDAATSDRVFEFAGIIPVRAGHDYNDGYREGTYNDSTDSKFYESFKDLQMTGPRVAQYWMCNNPELEDIWMVCNIGEDWVWMPDGTNGVSAYFNAHYENGRVDYTTQVAQKESWYTPTTPKDVHDSIHYNQIGYNELGRESVRNALIMLGEMEAPEVKATVEFLSWDGYTEVGEITASLEGNSGTLVVPKVYPVWKSKEVSYTLSEGLIWDYYDLLVADDSISGTLTSDVSTETVTVTGHSWSEWERVSEPSAEGPGQERRVCADCGLVDTKVVNGVWQIYDLNAHLLELPEYVCCDTNLWALLPHEDVHFTSGKKWGNTSTPVTSITIPVNPGDRIYATSWNKAGENGHATSDGIRLTFFNASGIALTLGPGESYRKFAANGGWLEAPEGSIAINVAMWYDSADYEVYILNRDHCYETVVVEPTCMEEGFTDAVCLACGVSTREDVRPPLGHALTDHVAKEPTCTEIGWNAYQACSRCDYTTYAEIPAHGHSYGEWGQFIAPTCDAEGQDVSNCTVCGNEIYRDTRISGDPAKILVSDPLSEDYFTGKRLLLIGDSITCGVGLSDPALELYGNLVGKTLGMTVTNKAISGSGFCTGGKMRANDTLTEANVRNADLITIMLGINDFNWAVKDGYWSGRPGYYDQSYTYYQLGEFGSDDTSTFYGALKAWCEKITELKQIEGFEEKEFVFITPMISSWNASMGGAKSWSQDKTNVHGHTIRQYCTAIMEVCAAYSIPVFDANMFSGLYYNSAEDNNVGEAGGDGVHVNAAGHALLAESLTEFLLEGYSYEGRTVTDCGHSYETAVTDPTCIEAGYTTYRCPECHYSYKGDYTDALGHDCHAGLCTTCGHDSVEATVDNGILTVTCDELEPDTIIWLVSYDGNGKFVSMKRVTLGEALTLPAGERYVLLFVDENWTPLRNQLEL